MKSKSRVIRAKARKRPNHDVGRGERPGNTIALVRIGNSRGVRLPKAVIEQAKLGDRVQLVVGNHEVILKSLLHPRAGWDELMRQAVAEHGAEPSAEDREWLDATIDAPVDDDKEWPW